MQSKDNEGLGGDATGRAANDNEHAQGKVATQEKSSYNVIGLVYVGKNVRGDFTFMIDQDQYKNCLFVFNENFMDSLDDEPFEGAGTAKIRPYKFLKPPRAAGIPTGWSVASRGFDVLNRLTLLAINASVDRLKMILKQNPNIDTIFFSANEDDRTKIGFKIFTLPPKVVDYISKKLMDLKSFNPNEFEDDCEEKIARIEDTITPHAEAQQKLARVEFENKVLKRKLSLGGSTRDVFQRR